jgi:hypothetical protein
LDLIYIKIAKKLFLCGIGCFILINNEKKS